MKISDILHSAPEQVEIIDGKRWTFKAARKNRFGLQWIIKKSNRIIHRGYNWEFGQSQWELIKSANTPT